MSTQITNYASVKYNYGDRGSDNSVSNIAVTTLLDAYALVGEKKSTSTSFRPNENITYLVKVTNTGTNPLYAVTIVDDLGGTTPASMNYVEGSGMLYSGGNLTTIAPTSTYPLTFTLPNALASNETVLIIYVAKVINEVTGSLTEITNTAVITGREGSTTGTVVNAESSPSVTLPIESYASVELLKEVSTDKIVSGETFSYTITVTNSGNLEAQNVIVTDTLPTGFTVGSITSTSGDTTTTFTNADYTVDASNTLTLPTSSSVSISVPPATSAGDGKTIITITGSIT